MINIISSVQAVQMTVEDDLLELVEKGSRLLENVQENLSHIEGSKKFENKVHSEVKFLR